MSSAACGSYVSTCCSSSVSTVASSASHEVWSWSSFEPNLAVFSAKSAIDSRIWDPGAAAVSEPAPIASLNSPISEKYFVNGASFRR